MDKVTLREAFKSIEDVTDEIFDVFEQPKVKVINKKKLNESKEKLLKESYEDLSDADLIELAQKYNIADDLNIGYALDDEEREDIICQLKAKNESCKESQQLEEQLPPDLAKAYRQAPVEFDKIGFTGVGAKEKKYDNRNSPYLSTKDTRRNVKTDYANSEYKEITPEEALQAKKDGNIGKLRILVNGKLIQYRNDGYPLVGPEIYNKDKTYIKKNGEAIFDTRRMPFNHIVKIADKIYLTDEDEHSIGKGGQEFDYETRQWKDVEADSVYNRRQSNQDIEDTGIHKKKEIPWRKSSMDNYKQDIKEYKDELAKLEQQWEAGDISKNEYEKKKAEYEKTIEKYTRWYKEYKAEYERDAQYDRNIKARKRYQVSQDKLQAPLNKLKDLKRDINYAKRDLNELENSGLSSWRLSGGSYKEKQDEIAKLKAQIEAAQKRIEQLEKESQGLDDANAKQNADAIEQAQNKVNDIQSQIDTLLRKNKNESCKESKSKQDYSEEELKNDIAEYKDTKKQALKKYILKKAVQNGYNETKIRELGGDILFEESCKESKLKESEGKDYSSKNAQPVLNEVEKLIGHAGSYRMEDVYDQLSIFDWWPDRLSQNHLRQMKAFLKLAIKLGYTGYVCFKVGASGCANGMWAHKEPTTNGYSPDSDAIYRSFTPDYTYYSVCVDGKWYPGEDTNGEPYDSCKTTRQLEELIAKFNGRKKESLDEDYKYDLCDEIAEVLDNYGIMYGDIVANEDGTVNIVGVSEDEWYDAQDAIYNELNYNVLVPDKDHEEFDDELIVTLDESCNKKSKRKNLKEATQIDIQDDEEVEKGKEILDNNKKADEDTEEMQVVDVDADTVDKLKDSYIGNVLLQCPICRTPIFKQPDKLVKDEENLADNPDDQLYNVGEQCPHCGQEKGFNLVGQVANMNVDNDKEDEETTGEEEVEKEDNFEQTTEDEISEQPIEDEEEVTFESFNTDRFNSIANIYLTEVYSNVDSFTTTNATVDDTNNKVIIEGVINYKSGKSKKTKFEFLGESVENNQYVFKGLNETFAKNDKAFTLKATIKDNTLISESLDYDYTVENKKLNESKIVKGSTLKESYDENFKPIKLKHKNGKEEYIVNNYGNGYQVAGYDGFGNFNPWQKMITRDEIINGEKYNFVTGYEIINFDTPEEAIEWAKDYYKSSNPIVEVITESKIVKGSTLKNNKKLNEVYVYAKGSEIAKAIANHMNKIGNLNGYDGKEKLVPERNKLTIDNGFVKEVYRFNDDGSVDFINWKEWFDYWDREYQGEEWWTEEEKKENEKYKHFDSVKDLLDCDLTYWYDFEDKEKLKKEIETILNQKPSTKYEKIIDEFKKGKVIKLVMGLFNRGNGKIAKNINDIQQFFEDACIVDIVEKNGKDGIDYELQGTTQGDMYC